MKSLVQLVKYIYSHPKKSKLCGSLSPVQIAGMLNDSLALGGLLVVYNDSGCVEGVAITTPTPECKILYVDICVVNHSRALSLLIHKFSELFSGFELHATRNSEYVIYKRTNRMLQFLQRKGV
jgi:hypothetical protein